MKYKPNVTTKPKEEVVNGEAKEVKAEEAPQAEEPQEEAPQAEPTSPSEPEEDARASEQSPAPLPEGWEEAPKEEAPKPASNLDRKNSSWIGGHSLSANPPTFNQDKGFRR